MGPLTERVHNKFNTPAWKSLRDLFVQVAETILKVSPNAQADLAGSYVKFFASGLAPIHSTYAAVWPRVTLPKRLIVGLALPEDFEAERLGPPPERIVYRGIKKFLVIEEGGTVPQGLSGWAKLAFDEVVSSSKG
jgi:hypothetical protein